MQPILLIGVILFTGFMCGELVSRIKFPKVTGYIFAGILLNPELFHLVPQNFVDHTDPISNLSLSFITFSIGGTLLFSRLKKLGKSILVITIFEAEFAFLCVFFGFFFLLFFFNPIPRNSWISLFIPLSLILGSLGSPTDPSATLAVAHEYKAKGKVTSTILGVTAFDDILGILNYSIAIAAASILAAHESFSINSLLHPVLVIVSAAALGSFLGYLFNNITLFLNPKREGVFFVLIFSFLALCFGVTNMLGIDELLTSMSMGVVVVNYNLKQQKIFKMLERYSEELIFVLFFTIGAMHLDFLVLVSNIFLILIFIIFRATGKYLGTKIGAVLSKSPLTVKKHVATALIPQGGIVIGLALLIRQNSAFDSISSLIINIILGATIIHEIIGPSLAKMSLSKAGEIAKKRTNP